MKVPANHTEEQVLQIIENILKVLAPAFKFGYYDTDDMKQEGYWEALKLLEEDKFDGKRPLANFLFTHIKNRFINLRRNKLIRPDSPCEQCHLGEEPCNNGSYCSKYLSWKSRNKSKAGIMQPYGLANFAEDVFAGREDTVEEESYQREITKLIDENLPVELRPYYLKMKAGVFVQKNKRTQVAEAIREIIGYE